MHFHFGKVIADSRSYTLRECRCGDIKTSFNPRGGYSPKPKAWPYVRLNWISKERWQEVQETTREFDPHLDTYRPAPPKGSGGVPKYSQ